MGFLIALQFLTAIPIPLHREISPDEVGKSSAYFPLVGLLLGGILFGIDRGLSLILPSAVVNALLIVALVILIGASHLDGFIDTCDGFLAGRTPQRRLEIMSDKRVGAFGIAGACCLFITKYAALSGLPATLRMEALLLMPMLSRWAMVYAIFAFPYARKPPGLGGVFKQGTNWQRFALATLIAVAVAVILMRWQGLLLMAIFWVIVFGVASLFSSKLGGGLTGDIYGALNEMSEVLVLILLSLEAGLWSSYF